MMTPVWKNNDLEGAVIGAIFLRNTDPEVLGILSVCRRAYSPSVSTVKFILAFVVRLAEPE
jgi:hypothetical protein